MKIAIKILLALLVLLVLAVAGLGIYLSQANLAPIAIKAAKSLYNIDIPANDTLVIKLFPTLHITGKDVVIPSLSAHETPLLKAGSIDAHIGWSSFPQFWANPKLQNVTLSNATITLYQPATGQANWMLPQQTTSTPTSDTATTAPAPFTIPTFGQISLTNVAIDFEDAKTKQKVNVQNINLDVNGENLSNLAATLSARLNNQSLSGEITTNATDLSDVPLKGELTFGNLKANLDARVENQKSFAGQITLQTPNVRDTYKQLTTQSMETLPAEALRLTTAVEADDTSYKLQGLKLTLGNILQLSGNLEGKIQPAPTAKGQINLQSSNARALAAALQGVSNPSIPAESIRLSSSLDYDPTNVKLTGLNLAVADVLTANGTFSLQPQSMDGSAELSLQGSSLRQVAEVFLGASQPNLPAQPFTGSTIAKITKDAISLPDINLSVPNALRVKANVTMAQKVPAEINGSATFEQLNLQAFGLCTQPAPAAGGTAAQTAAANAKPAAAPWNDDVIDLSGLQSFVGSFDVNVSNITCPSVPLQNIAAKISNTPESLAIENMSMNLSPSGKATVAGSIGHSGKTMQPKLQIKLVGFPAESLMPKASWSQGLQLPINADVTLAANGNTTRKIAQTLNGTVDVTSSGGRIPASKPLNGLLNIEALLNGDPVPQGNGQEINDMKANYNIVNGVATANTVTAAVANNRISVNGVGDVNLVGWTISHTLFTTVSNQKDIPLTIRGNLNAPQFNLDDALKNRVKDRLLKEGGEEINKFLTGSNITGSKTEVITNAVGNLLGGKGLDQQGVQNLLGAFTKPKAVATPSPTEAAPAATETAPAVTTTPTE